MQQNKRVPYVKLFEKVAYGEEPILLNPITKDNPYLHRRVLSSKTNSKNNKKGVRLVIMNLGFGIFTKYHIRKQTVSDKNGGYKVIYHYIDKNAA